MEEGENLLFGILLGMTDEAEVLADREIRAPILIGKIARHRGVRSNKTIHDYSGIPSDSIDFQLRHTLQTFLGKASRSGEKVVHKKA